MLFSCPDKNHDCRCYDAPLSYLFCSPLKVCHFSEGTAPLTRSGFRQTRAMSQVQDRRIVLSSPGFPISSDDPDKRFLLTHAMALRAAGFHVTVVCPALPGLSGRDEVEGVQVLSLIHI